MRKWLYRGWKSVILVVIVGILLINGRFYWLSARKYTPESLGPDVLAQLRFLRQALESGAGESMQQYFPEGFFFTATLYGLAWVEVGLREPIDSPLRRQALQEASWALELIDSPTGRAPFSQHLDPPLGVFYVGWSNWLRGGVLMLAPDDGQAGIHLAQFEADCAALAAAFDASTTPFLMAYPNQAWPVDSTVAMAALSLHDSIVPPKYQATRERWVANAKQLLDPATGLLPHRVNPQTGKAIGGARGSSQSIISRFLPEIDPIWAAQQYALFREYFVAKPLAVPGIREYPRGVAGGGDVDSGPLIFGVSASATVVTMGAAFANGDRELAEAILSTTEALGMPVTWNGKRYAFGMLPVGDAFLVWGKTARHWIPTAASATLPPLVPWWWRWPLHGLSLLVIGGLWWSVRWLRPNP